MPAETLSGTHTLLDREAIERTGARDLAELLRTLGVVHLSQSGTKGSLSTVSLRAAKTNFTLVLVDGVPVNDIGDLLGGAFNFATLSVDDIDRIDILRGPLSSVYGSEASGGVISITLRRPAEEPVLRASVEGGEFGYAAGSGGVSAVRGRLSGSASGGIARMGEQVLGDGFLLGTAGVQAALAESESRHIAAFGRWDRLSSTGFPVSSGGPLFALSRTLETDQANQTVGGATFSHQATRRWFYTGGYDLFSRVALNDTPAILDSIPPGRSYVPSTHSDTRFLRQRVLSVQRIQALAWLALDGVLSFRQEDGTSTGTLAAVLPASYTQSRGTGFFSGNATIVKGGLSLTGGLGIERPSGFRTVLSPRAGASYSFSQTRLRASWGKGFKMPSFYSLGSPLVGNPALKPEYSTGFDAGIEHSFAPAKLHLALTGFNNGYRDLIDFDPTIFRLVNRSSGFGCGVELESSAAIERAEIGGSVSYVDAGLEGTTARLRDVPRWTEDVHLWLPVSSALRAGLTTVWVGRRFDYQVPVPQYGTVGAYSVTSVAVNYRIREGLEGHIRLENLFDRKYQEFVGFPSPGVYASGGLTYSGRAHGSAH